MKIQRIINNILFVLLLVVFGCQAKAYEPEAVSFSVESGAYPDAVTLRLSAPEGYTIRYTTDYSVPNKGSKRYSKELHLSGSGEGWLNDVTIDLIHVDGVYDLKETPDLADAWIIRAAVFAPDGTMGPISTKTYFPNRSIFADYNGTMLISVATDPENLLDYEKGILAKGKVFDQWRFMLYDTDFSSGLYEDDRTAVDRNSVNDVMANHPLFALAIESPEFCEMFMMSLKQIGENDLSPERVETTLDEWAEYRGGLMGDQYLRFGDYSLQWDRQLEAIKPTKNRECGSFITQADYE